jgi:hypothetical protein
LYGVYVCVVRQKSLRRADHSPRGVLTTVARRCVWSRNLVIRGHNPRWDAEPEKIIITTTITNVFNGGELVSDYFTIRLRIY